MASSNQARTLVREVIKQNLYKSLGYFSKQNPIMSPSAPINFPAISNFNAWQSLQNELFHDRSDKGQQFLTQCELFKPYYSQLLADWSVKRMRARGHSKLKVLEVGGGTGAHALHFLNHMQDEYPEIYRTMTYTLCEQTDTLCQAQTQLLSKDHAKVCRFYHQDFLTWNQFNQDPTVLFLLEVLDNLPHDKVSFENKFALQQVSINALQQEVLDPIQDKWIQEAVHYFIAQPQQQQHKPTRKVLGEDWYHQFLKFIALVRRRRCEKKATSEFVPSSAMKLMHVLHQYFPQHDVFMSDFAYLPFPNVLASKHNLAMVGSVFQGRNVPIVSGSDDQGIRQDFASYLTPNADVFFQTNFPLLANAYEGITVTGEAQVFTHRAFMESEITSTMRMKTSTRSGYNPMMEDFRNISVLVGCNRG
ncbi:hypothetical protein BASA81_005466 [Batrachochytrium salamandrivorans]|nr:hypothetical protein BASA81_005466 [Batrachochytrium salamandrivorans]